MSLRNLNQAMDLLWDLWHSLPSDHPDFTELDNAYRSAWDNLTHVNNLMEWNGEE